MDIMPESIDITSQILISDYFPASDKVKDSTKDPNSIENSLVRQKQRLVKCQNKKLIKVDFLLEKWIYNNVIYGKIYIFLNHKEAILFSLASKSTRKQFFETKHFQITNTQDGHIRAMRGRVRSDRVESDKYYEKVSSNYYKLKELIDGLEYKNYAIRKKEGDDAIDKRISQALMNATRAEALVEQLLKKVPKEKGIHSFSGNIIGLIYALRCKNYTTRKKEGDDAIDKRISQALIKASQDGAAVLITQLFKEVPKKEWIRLFSVKIDGPYGHNLLHLVAQKGSVTFFV